MENSQEGKDQVLIKIQQVKMEWVKPRIRELVTHDGVLGTQDVSGDVTSGGS